MLQSSVILNFINGYYSISFSLSDRPYYSRYTEKIFKNQS